MALMAMMFAAAGCGGSEEPKAVAPATPTAVMGTPREPAAPRVEPIAERVGRLSMQDLRAGRGPTASATSVVLIRYVAADARTASAVESSYENGAPFEVQLGHGLLAPGLERGIVGMREGGRRRIEAPRRLTGRRRALVYVVDLVKVL